LDRPSDLKDLRDLEELSQHALASSTAASSTAAAAAAGTGGEERCEKCRQLLGRDALGVPKPAAAAEPTRAPQQVTAGGPQDRVRKRYAAAK
jgi:hypothetical protein